ncbi:MAG TPA: DPP IV N-terminal domain-containing protein [Verrucomicrobiae bacterium]|jgi:Tol biopolymer transport system component
MRTFSGIVLIAGFFILNVQAQQTNSMPTVPIGKLAFVTSDGFGSSGRISVIEGSHQTWTQAYKTRDLEFLPDGNRIIYSANDVIRGEDGRESVANGIYIYDLTQHTNSLVMTNVESGAEPSVSPDGSKIAFVKYGDGRKSAQIYMANVDGSNLKQLTDGEYYNWTPRWSPDGKQLVFETTRNDNPDNHVKNGGYRDIYVMDTDGQNQINLTTNSYGHHPSWSPDGKSIAYMVHGNVFVMRADGSDKQNISKGTTRDSEPFWSPDGQWIAFTRTAPAPDSAAMDIWIMKSDGTEQSQLTFNKTNFTSYSPVWSK